ncbi:hypothetical protein A6J40_15130 [Legionella longbeachae]|uniref:Uncharacterized protein n=1 Tax=Legionella longbeachae serogroup 1 (strain NSW150) TaxID=661367 RepID=D3HL72_LEGLN|nr:hypothetical protein A6J40_15130 [Legionella longbeachae]EEZ93674.1 hypothetical protein LLB_2566 [Legionella longbeachae D-4968]CBJ13191.1 protein of unknown function [Legionella longbeachae NSW150]ARM33475.1 hypothetical protein B0B39_08015 [Legionella longbeachae]QIN33398.1 hypothetical protein GCB94_15185 [Legionella longbeachae]
MPNQVNGPKSGQAYHKPTIHSAFCKKILEPLIQFIQSPNEDLHFYPQSDAVRFLLYHLFLI